MKWKRKAGFKGNTGKGQVSAEMILLIAAVLAVALILVSKMQDTAKKGADAIDKGAQKLFSEINDTSALATKTAKRAGGADCTKDSQCESGDCDDYLKVCK